MARSMCATSAVIDEVLLKGLIDKHAPLYRQPTGTALAE
jgi:hypothetical protein